MKSSIKQVNINTYQIVFILIICRWQSFMISVHLRRVLEVNNSNIFISILMSLGVAFLVYIPAFILLKRFQYMNVIDISRRIFPKFGNIISIIFSLYFLTMVIVHIANTGFFMICYVYINATPFIIVGIVVVAMYAIFMGVQSIFRFGSVILILFLTLSILVMMLLYSTYDFNCFGPFVLSDLSSIIDNTWMLTFNAELVALLVLAEYCKQKTFLTYASFQVVLCFMETLLIIVTILSMGYYTNTNTFPVYTLVSMVEVPILDRCETLYIVLDTMLSVVKTSIYLFLSYKCLKPVIGGKFNKLVIILLGTICVFSSVFIIYNISLLETLLSWINSPIVVLFFIVVIPLILLISYKLKSIYKAKKVV